MPSQTVHYVLTEMYVSCNEAPWGFPTWQELTSVRHGLFPDDDRQLPAGWTRQTAVEISSYFSQFRARLAEEERATFSKADDGLPGRRAWRNWVTKLWKDARIHAKIIEVLSSENLHPYRLAQATITWPDANTWVPLAVDPVGLALFGEECYGGGVERVNHSLRNLTKMLITRTWILLNNGLTRCKKKIQDQESEAMKAFEGSYNPPCLEFS